MKSPLQCDDIDDDGMLFGGLVDDGSLQGD